MTLERGRTDFFYATAGKFHVEHDPVQRQLALAFGCADPRPGRLFARADLSEGVDGNACLNGDLAAGDNKDDTALIALYERT